jgi:hypothetical protein
MICSVVDVISHKPESAELDLSLAAMAPASRQGVPQQQHEHKAPSSDPVNLAHLNPGLAYVTFLAIIPLDEVPELSNFRHLVAFHTNFLSALYAFSTCDTTRLYHLIFNQLTLEMIITTRVEPGSSES